MKVNNLEAFLEKVRGGKLPLGCCVTFADPAVTEVAVASGFDFVWIDGEHGEMDRNTAMLDGFRSAQDVARKGFAA